MKTVNTPSGQLIQTCLFCKHFEFQPEYPGYSEWTPGSPLRMSCDRDHWALDGIVDFRETMLTAQTCPDYEAVKEVTNEP